MPTAPVSGVCILSIDFVTHVAAVASKQRKTPESAVAELCRQFAAANVPITLSLSAMPSDKLRDAISEHGDCEISLLAEASWAAEGASRGVFSQALVAGLATLDAAGFAVTTLVVPSARLAAHDDLLMRHGVNAVRVGERRHPASPARAWWPRARSTSPAKALNPLRWGLWEAVVNVDLGALGLSGALRIVDRLTRQGGLAIVAANAETLTGGAKFLPRLVDHIKRRRDENALVIQTLAGAVARQQLPRQTPARSILRPAA